VRVNGNPNKVEDLYSSISLEFGVVYPENLFIETPYGNQEVFCITKTNKTDVLYEIQTEDGVLRLTESHILPVNRNGTRIFVCVKDILVSDVIYCIN
jgi:hypothetical protein